MRAMRYVAVFLVGTGIAILIERLAFHSSWPRSIISSVSLGIVVTFGVAFGMRWHERRGTAAPGAM